jgi:subtilase family serine protease
MSLRKLSQIVLTSSLVFLAPFCSSASGQDVSSRPLPFVPSRVTEHVDEMSRVTLRGNTYPMARKEFDQGLVEASKPMERIMMVLKRSPEQDAALAAFDERLYDPNSSDFHHWMHAEEFGKTYGPSDADIATVTGWLESHGFQIYDVSKGRVSIQFSGTAAQVNEAFHVEMHKYLVDGVQHISNDRDPQIPAALAPVVMGISSMNDFRPKHFSHPGAYVKRDRKTGAITLMDTDTTPQPIAGLDGVSKFTPKATTELGPIGAAPQLGFTDASTGYQREDLTPYDVATIYNILPLWKAGIDGTGQKIAIIGLSSVVSSDISTFRSSFGLPPINFTYVTTGTDPGITDSQGENTEDVEMAGSTAPGAAIILVGSVSTATTDGVKLSAQYVIDHETANILTGSYGACELKLGSATNTLYNNLWQQAATQGISVFFAAGDSGSSVCTSQTGTPPYGDQYGLAVSGMASSPYVTAVGGTDVQWYLTEAKTPASTYWNSTNTAGTLASAKGYMPEMSWNNTCANPLLLNVFSETTNEQMCNDAINGDPGLVEMASGSGGVSNCTTNSTTDTSTTFNPSSCSGGWAKPSYQTGTGVPADGKRDLPDVSMFAAYGYQHSTGIPGTALLICQASDNPQKSCDYSNPNYIIYQENGGTSAASPLTAGIMALVLQKTGQQQGLANPVFYSLAAKDNRASCNSNTVAAGNSCVFYDITQGSNAQVCYTGDPNCVTNTSTDAAGIVSGYSATVGYDLTTGLGTMNVNNLVNAWPTTTSTATLSFTPTSLTFGSTALNTASAAQSVTVKNTGTTSVTFNTIGLTGSNDFLITGTTCPSPLAANATCTVSVDFKPVAAGAVTGAISFADSATGSPQTVGLSGTGAAAALTVTVSPSSLTFASTTVGVTTAAQVVTVKNTSASAVTLGTIGFTGTGATSYVKSATTCGTSLAAGASCTISVEFKPTAAGSLPASLSIADNATGTPQLVSLTGTGVAAALTVTVSPGTLTFASTTVGSTTAAQVVTVKNTSVSAVTLGTIGFTGTGATSYVKSATTCTTSLAAAASCTISVEFKPTVAGSLPASLSIADNATGTPQLVAITGTGVAAALTVTVAPTALTFASTTVGSTTAAQVVTVKNTSVSAVTLGTIGFTGTGATSYVKSATTCTTSLAAAASCTISVEFKPTVAGSLPASLSIADNATGTPQLVAITGTGVAAALTVTVAPTALTFASTTVGSTTAAQVVTVKNTSVSAVTLGTIGFTGTNATSFVKSATTCTTSLAAAASCTISVEFKPTVAGSLTASLSIADNATGTPQLVALKGTAVAAALTVTVAPSALTFASTTVGSTTAAQVVTVKNTSVSAVTLGTIGFTGTGASSYVKSATTCTTSLAAAASCTISVEFKPTVAGSLPASLSIADNATGTPQLVAITGTGIAPGALGLSVTSLAFPATVVGSTSDLQTVTLSNPGTIAATISSIAISGTNASSFVQLHTCGATLAAGASCTFYVSFKPTVAGSLSGTLTITDNATGSPQKVTLTGKGTAVPVLKLSATTLAFGTVKVGSSSAIKTVTLTNSGTAVVELDSITLGGTNSTSFLALDTCGATLTAGATCTVYVGFTPTVTGALTASLSIVSNGSGSPQTVAFTGTGN